MADNNEVELLVFEKNLKIENAIDGLKLNKLSRYVGDIPTITAICFLLNRFNLHFNFGKSLSSQQSAILASDIVEKYPYETIEDVVLILKQVRQGSIGDGKDYKLDGQNVMTKWFPEYLDKKYEQMENQKKKELAELNSKNDNDAVSKYYAKIRREKLQKKKDEKAKSEIDKMCLYMDRQLLEDTISDWSQKEEMKPYLDYLKQKRKNIK